jgi:DivIVA domain-containing protein
VDRDAIERRDFPLGRRGYDTAAVDAHLRAVADDFEGLRVRAATPARPPELSAGTAEQVRKILEAAERSAAELRDEAAKEAGDHVARVEIAAGQMLGRLDGLQRELDGLVDSLKRSGELLEDGLARLRADVGEAGAAAPAPPEPAAPAAPPAPPEPDPVPEPPVVPAVAPAIDEPADPAAIAAANGEAKDRSDEAGARLIALNMALSGSPREETARYLAEHYALPDAGALLDDVYARAGEAGA